MFSVLKTNPNTDLGWHVEEECKNAFSVLDTYERNGYVIIVVAVRFESSRASTIFEYTRSIEHPEHESQVVQLSRLTPYQGQMAMAIKAVLDSYCLTKIE